MKESVIMDNRYLNASPCLLQYKAINKHQSGAVLVIGLIMLLLLTLIGVTGSQVTGLEEKMSGNIRDRNIAFQAAESALRDAEQDIRGVGTAPRNPKISGSTNFYVNCNFDNALNSFDDGLCDRKWNSSVYVEPTYSGSSIVFPAFTYNGNNYAALTVDMTNFPPVLPATVPSVGYGQFTGVPPISGVSAQPRYIIEVTQANPPGCGNIFYYRITVRAQGVNANTVVWLQSIYNPTPC